MKIPNISGHFVYRSLLNNPVVGDDFSKLRFGEGLMTLVQTKEGHITGDFVIGGSLQMKLDGSITGDEKGLVLRMTAKGTANTPTAGWIYDYLGYINPIWQMGINQLQTITGSVIRTVDHGNAKAGVTATFYMVRKD
jgi:hypothetical protein